MATGFGLRLVGRIGGGQPRVREYYVPSTDATELLQGDVVELVNALDPLNEVPVVTRATAGNVLLGAIVGFKVDASDPYAGTKRTASTNRYVLVCDDPEAVFEVQEDAVGGSVSAAAIGEMENADIIVASGALGLSGTMLDSSTASASSANLKIVGVRRDGVNAGGSTSVLLVKIHEHALTTSDSRS
jgi:hypothetical protein